MRVNVYTEELLQSSREQPACEVVTAEYVSSRTGEKMTNYGLRVFMKSAPDLHYVPGRDDDRSAVTFWCGSHNVNILAFLDQLKMCAEEYNLMHHRAKVREAAARAEVTEADRRSLSTLEQFDNMVGHIVGISDERDVISLLLGLRDMWPKLKEEITKKREYPHGCG